MVNGPRTVDTVFILPHTHWDREWYLPFEQFRMQLVDVVDRLLTLMQDPAYERFTLDGQSIVLDDYLAIRPEREGALRRLAQDGRVVVGPWYVLPDEFLVSGEALIRNLTIGWRKAARFGSPMAVGYLPDSFGHIAQMPQILRGFGIDGAMLSRGVGDGGGAEFWWQGLDGSRVLVLHQLRGYCNLVAAGYPTPADVLNGREPEPERAAAHVRRELSLLGPLTRAGIVLLNCGCDHQPPHPRLPQVVRSLQQAMPELQFKWGTPREVLDTVLSRRPTLDTVKGELRGSRYAPLIPGVLSARVYLKQANHAAQMRLERWAEPLATVAWMLGGPDQRAFLTYAWETLLQNHPHDSICGCSVDAVHREMLPRFDRVREIASHLTDRAIETIATRVHTAGLPEGLPLMVVNPVNWDRSETVRTTVVLPLALLRRLRAVDETGRVHPVQVLRTARDVLAREAIPPAQLAHRLSWLSHEVELAWGVRFSGFTLRGNDLRIDTGHQALCPPDLIDRMIKTLQRRTASIDVRVERLRAEIAIFVTDVPSVGYRTIVLQPGRLQPFRDSVAVRGTTLHDRRLSVGVGRDGTVAVHDAVTARRIRGHFLEDSADAGDEYDYSPIGERPTILRTRGRVEVPHRGPVVATCRVHLPLRLPAGLHEDRKRRAREQVPCPVTVDVSLSAGSRLVEFETTIDNRARDHRLRMVVPSGVRAQSYMADVQFGAVERSLVRPAGEGWAQPPPPTAPHQSWIDVSDGAAGIAVLSEGLHEHEVVRASEGLSVALSLLRCIGWLSRHDLVTRRGHAGPGYETPEAQCQGTHTFRYALLPHAGRWTDGDLTREALAFQVPLVAVPVGRHEGSLPPSLSFLRCSGAVVSALKPAESGDGFVLRIYNSMPTLARAVIQTPLAAQAQEISLDEQPRTQTVSAEGSLELELPPFEIRGLTFAGRRSNA